MANISFFTRFSLLSIFEREGTRYGVVRQRQLFNLQSLSWKSAVNYSSSLYTGICFLALFSLRLHMFCSVFYDFQYGRGSYIWLAFSASLHWFPGRCHLMQIGIGGFNRNPHKYRQVCFQANNQSRSFHGIPKMLRRKTEHASTMLPVQSHGLKHDFLKWFK